MYIKPANSLIAQGTYWLLGLRARGIEVDKAIADLKQPNANSLTIIGVLLNQGGWEDNSLNTNFVRRLVKQLPQYDTAIELKPNEVELLAKHLLKSITATPVTNKIEITKKQLHKQSTFVPNKQDVQSELDQVRESRRKGASQNNKLKDQLNVLFQQEPGSRTGTKPGRLADDPVLNEHSKRIADFFRKPGQ